MTELIEYLKQQVQVGDMVLAGGTDPVSRVIQIGSRSPYSHVAVVTGGNELTEAYDYALTPTESDEGIFRLTIEAFVGRSSGLCRILVLRPIGVDRHRVVETAAHLFEHSPGFPTLGMACLALCGLSGPALRLLPTSLRRRAIAKQIRLAADGVRRMHCAETVIRIYHEAGLTVRFTAPRLSFHIAQLGPELTSSLVDLPSEERVAEKGRWPSGPQPLRSIRSVAVAVGSTLATWRTRARASDDIDMADLILPGDFTRAEPFETVGRLIRSGTRWDVAA
ncbi:MAG: hypothetical protein ACR2QK_12935 [Acidimicrobiales bacterium]